MWSCSSDRSQWSRLADPVIHRRRVEFDTNKRVIVVKDILQCRGEHQLALHWHFAEGCQVDAGDGGRTLAARGARHTLELRCAFGEASLLRGSEQPIAGWISRTFDAKAPITTARWQGTVLGTTEIVTELHIRATAGSTIN